MNEHYCEEHRTPYFEHSKNGKTWYSHKIQGTETYHNEKDANPAYTNKMAATADEIREKLEDAKPRDYEAENRGKVRHGIVVAMIEHDGLQLVHLELINTKEMINDLVEFVMSGK